MIKEKKITFNDTHEHSHSKHKNERIGPLFKRLYLPMFTSSLQLSTCRRVISQKQRRPWQKPLEWMDGCTKSLTLTPEIMICIFISNQQSTFS